MTSAGDEDTDSVLSDVEADDDPASITINTTTTSGDGLSTERFREISAELDRERQAREAAEKSKSELQVSFNRLKALAHEALKKREEALREKEEALRTNEKVSQELSESVKLKDDIVNQRDELARQFEELSKSKDSARGEIETAAHMLVTGIEKISGKVSSFKNFTAGGLPRSQNYTGLPAVAYGVIKRTNDIVEELLKQVESASKSATQAREQMDHRNYEIAIEVSQLEATISGLREDVATKTSALENLEKSVAEKDDKLSELERDMLEKQNSSENEILELRQLVSDYDDKVRNLESKIDTQRSLVVDQLSYVAKIHDQIHKAIKIVDDSTMDHSELSESLFLPQEMDMEESIRASLAGMEFIYELSTSVVTKTRDLVEERSREVKSLNEMVSRLAKEKEHIGSLLRSALSRRISTDVSSKTNEVFKVAENGLQESGIDFKFKNHLGGNKEGDMATEGDEIYTLAGALENVIKQSQLEIIELRHSVDELRAETSLLKQQVETQSKELILRKQRMEELEERERLANDNVEGLMLDIAAAEEEITRWKVAAEQEAEAGKAVEQDFLAQLSAVRQEVEEARHAVIESEKKLTYKEQTADAAMAARDAAENSLRLADIRASRLRDKVEELTHQLEKQDTTRDISGQMSSRARYACWPWQWLGLNYVGYNNQPHTQLQQQASNEMELSEPFL
jgi:hypothetical protein